MDTRTDLDAEIAHSIADRQSAADGARRAVERGEESVPRRVHLDAAMSLQLRPDERVVPLDERAPPAISQLGGLRGAVHDVGEQHGRKESVVLRQWPGAGQEFLDLADDLGFMRDMPEVITARQLHVARARNVGREVPPLLYTHIAIAIRLQHERGHAHERKNGPHVDERVHPHERGGGARARAAPLVRGEPLGQLGVPRRARRVEAHVSRAAPLALGLHDSGHPVVERGCPGIVVGSQSLRERPVRDEGARALRIRRREDDGHTSAFGMAEQRGALAADRVHHGAHVVHAHFDGRQVRDIDAIRQPRAALVEEDEPAERRKVAERSGLPGLFPHQLDVRHEARHVDEIERPIADDLVRDAQVAALRILGLRNVHATRLPLA